MMVHTCKPRTWEVEAKFMTSLNHKSLSFEKRKRKERRPCSNQNKLNSRKQGESALESVCGRVQGCVKTLDSGPQGMCSCLAGNKLQITVETAKYLEAVPQLT